MGGGRGARCEASFKRLQLEGRRATASRAAPCRPHARSLEESHIHPDPRQVSDGLQRTHLVGRLQQRNQQYRPHAKTPGPLPPHRARCRKLVPRHSAYLACLPASVCECDRSNILSFDLSHRHQSWPNATSTRFPVDHPHTQGWLVDRLGCRRVAILCLSSFTLWSGCLCIDALPYPAFIALLVAIGASTR